MTDYSITNLLQQVKVINSKYDSLAKLTGENFNVFTIMRSERDEVFTHSAFIAELLNPKGCHEQGDVFLKIFLKYLNDSNESYNLPEIDSFRTRTSVEKYIGTINEDSSEGGRIDISIEDAFNLLMIENKVDAGDQKNQLLRYYNYGKDRNKNFRLIYLTLEDKKINDFTTGTNDEVKQKIISITYRRHIIEWLEICKKETVDHPILRETITQYINLIKRLTNQTINNQMSTELVKTLTASSENFNAAKSVYNEYEHAQNKIHNKFWQYVASKICIELGIDWNFQLLDRWGILFYYKDYNFIGFGFDKLQENKLFFGILNNPDKSINDFKRESYKDQINKMALDILPGGIFSDLWIKREFYDSVNIYEENNLRSLLPLDSPESVGDLSTEVIEEFKKFRTTYPKYEVFIKEVVDQSENIYKKLDEIKSIISSEVSLPSIDIWEKSVLYIYRPTIDNMTLALDVYVKNDMWVVEIFIKNLNDRQMIDSCMNKYTLFKDINLSNDDFIRTLRNGIIYKTFDYGSIKDVADTVVMILNETTI